MTKASSILSAKRLADDISAELNELAIQTDNRSRVAAACYFAALDHHQGITVLFDEGIPSPALALLRPLYESFVRGSWLHGCATDAELQHFLDGKELPKISELLRRLEETDEFDSKILSSAHGKNWAVLCSLTHTGIQQVLMCVSEDAIERNCSTDLIDEAMGYAGVYALMAGIGVARLTNNNNLAERLLTIAKEFLKA